MTFDRFQRGGGLPGRGGDRRLTMIDLIRADGSVFEDVESCHVVFQNEEVSEWDYVQYLGEHMVR